MLIPLLLTPAGGKPEWKDPLRVSILATWTLAYIATPVEGFFIEFNEATLSGNPMDTVFGNEQYFALFGILMVTIAFLAVDFYQDRKESRSMVATLGMLVTIFTLIAGYIFTYFDPGVLNADGSLAATTTWGWIYAAGLLLVSVVIFAAMAAVLRGAEEPISTMGSPSPVAASHSKQIAFHKTRMDRAWSNPCLISSRNTII